MCFGKIKAWRIRRRAAKKIKLRSVDEVLIKYRDATRAQMKAGREENCKDSNYNSGFVDALKWIMKEK
uniref:Uncharacterized protein n=1 Tax=viral metagenome TaxID=1070528 RepID=A0A6M3XZB1_9ZZZZ